ncbi:MAG: hypothetical protein KJ970_10740 [Candidatus Eisenbacteria bacterium]|uniref:Uncharacterized protein n=1 Tax=Eiseniibacteriota bacterium TaxID=2212470 RepID=A0A948W794_UNCEI|nr:hypothetical protein [Candidatus Eisenbacteria bacterium]
MIKINEQRQDAEFYFDPLDAQPPIQNNRQPLAEFQSCDLKKGYANPEGGARGDSGVKRLPIADYHCWSRMFTAPGFRRFYVKI